MLSTVLSSFFSVAHADAPEEQSKDQPEEQEGGSAEEPEEGEQGEGAEKGEEEEEEEPEDIHPTLRDECSNSAQCVGFKKHFEHCQEKVEAGEGFKGEDCVEEMCDEYLTGMLPFVVHMMHCADNCLAPTLFSKLN